MALVIPVMPNSSDSSDSKGKVGITKDWESCPDDYWGWGGGGATKLKKCQKYD